ncbi:hypothetical protein ACIP88_18010 [Streptomyces uncialis]|uniref:hypothetical protein n=1 Tax=Streptomyces uncialis TaxID=1048205 RepID=UPI00380FCBAA
MESHGSTARRDLLRVSGTAAAAALTATGPVRFTGCTLTGAPDTAPLHVGAADLTVVGGTLTDTGIELSAVRDQRLHLDGTRLTGTNNKKALLGRATGPGTITWQLSGTTSTTGDADTAHLRITDGTNHYSAFGCRLSGGTLHLEPAACADTVHTACVEHGTRRTALPETGPAAHVDGNVRT